MQTAEKLAAKIENATRLAALAIARADRYRAAGAPRMAAHHDIKATAWSSLADDLRAELSATVSVEEDE